MTNESHESILLLGGRTAQEVIRIENTVRRSVGPHAEFKHALLKLLEEKGFAYAPRFLGIDEKGREILTFIEGDVPHGEINWTNDHLIKVAEIIKDFHNATAGSDLAQDKEVVCHNDLAPWNLILKNNVPTSFIDFDDATPGNRIDDIAYFLWTFLDLGNDVSADVQAVKMRMSCDAYEFTGGSMLIDAILGQQHKILAKRRTLAKDARDQESREFSEFKVSRIISEIEWIKTNRITLENAF